MGVHGPVPKRTAERRRQNKPATPLDSIQVIGSVRIPPANPKWHAIAKRLYLSLRTSGQAKFYEESDWSVAYLLAESLSRDLKPKVVAVTGAMNPDTAKIIRAYVPISGASLSSYLKAFAVLGVTEGDRRRIGIEIERAPAKPELASVSVMDEYRDALGG